MAIPCATKPGFVYTVYPCAVDNSTIPIAIDEKTPVDAEIANRLREGILSTQYELGLNPSGTYTTVRARLDALEDLIASIIGGGGAAIIVKENGTVIVPAATSIDFIGATVTSGGGGSAIITVTGGSSLTAPTLLQNGFAAIASGGDLTYVGGSPGQVLAWNGSSWVGQAVTGTLFTEVDGTLTTVNSTPATLISYATSSNGTYNVYFQVAARNVINGNGNGYNVAGVFKRVAGVLSQVGSTSILNYEADDLTMSVDLSISGSNILLRVVGNSSLNVNWKAVGQIVIAV